jgi:hypothetical protein
VEVTTDSVAQDIVRTGVLNRCSAVQGTACIYGKVKFLHNPIQNLKTDEIDFFKFSLSLEFSRHLPREEWLTDER